MKIFSSPRQLVLVLVFGISLLSFAAQAQTLRVATFNVRVDVKADSLNPWKDRYPQVANLIKLYDFDVVGTQEGKGPQIQHLQEELPGFAFAGVGRDDGKEKGEYSAIFYRKDKFQLLNSGTFWFSTTPDKPSKGWDAAFPRICTWVQLKEKGSGFVFYVYNLHFDHRGVEARRESSKQILARMQAVAPNTPVVLMGDFNIDQDDESYQILNTSGKLKDAFETAQFKLAPNGTFNGFNVQRHSDRRIDHIFLTPQFEVKKYGILTNTYGPGKYPSDHFPVMVELAVVKKGKKK
ncbi:endonuclease/exonuclease/phosphatase family protein [Rufibacter quisquiliarum]|uniref:Endonuclease/exonuclease/phosphatase family metal-dependent hydrolase n=1 Tax=Rufibacter quisquiliarum TaxID=1549639 RepID=A0A839GRL0_9BACT|nr:endonuclease/exonuclease/phosphatase family protein [Rufibacter quisquiliarum]MBA9078145.1 endonuclease/exonuclease/phosphatase family metal-dependent hydrolase [Rufibacter quisquiliarum]